MNKKNVLIGVGIVVMVVLCIGIAIFAGTGGTDYYTQIDNTKVKEIEPHGAMNYSYTLTVYDENSTKRDITFETSKILCFGIESTKIFPLRSCLLGNRVIVGSRFVNPGLS